MKGCVDSIILYPLLPPRFASRLSINQCRSHGKVERDRRYSHCLDMFVTTSIEISIQDSSPLWLHVPVSIDWTMIFFPFQTSCQPQCRPVHACHYLFLPIIQIQSYYCHGLQILIKHAGRRTNTLNVTRSSRSIPMLTGYMSLGHEAENWEDANVNIDNRVASSTGCSTNDARMTFFTPNITSSSHNLHGENHSHACLIHVSKMIIMRIVKILRLLLLLLFFIKWTFSCMHMQVYAHQRQDRWNSVITRLSQPLSVESNGAVNRTNNRRWIFKLVMHDNYYDYCTVHYTQRVAWFNNDNLLVQRYIS